MRWLLLWVSLLVTAVPASARMGALDPTFGTDGIATVPLGKYVAHCYGAVRQPDGALVLAGGSDAEIDFDAEYDATLVRLLPNGRLDPAFGAGGIVVRRTGRSDYESTFKGLALGNDGSIVAVGSESSGGVGRILITRFDAAGRPDPAFDVDGRVSVTLSTSAQAIAVHVRGDGRILVAASVWYPGEVPGGFPGFPFHTDAALLQFTPDGQLDAEFGDGGVRIVDRRALEYAVALVVQSDGGFVFAAALLDGATLDYDVGLLRFDAHGDPDGSWGDHGLTLLDLGSSDDSANVIGLTGDRLLVGGGGSGIVMARLGRDGRLDPKFGVAGVARVASDVVLQRGLGVDALERPLVTVLEPGELDPGGRLVRFTKNGRLRAAIHRSPRLPLDPFTLVVQPDGRAVVVQLGGAAWQATRLRSRVGPPSRK